MKPQHAHLQQNTPRGIVKNAKGIGITTSGLPMSDHFFQASSYRIKKVGANLAILFGAQSAFADDSDTEYKLAVEIVYPVEMAVRYLYLMNWKGKSSGSNESFSEVVRAIVSKDLTNYVEPKVYKVPHGNSFRSFPANFSIMSVSGGQGAIEFFEAPPGTIVEAIFQTNGWRPNSDVRAVLTVVLPPVELWKLLEEVQSILKDQASELGPEELEI